MNISKVSRQRAFTLIELLVVIAIIGILTAVVLASLNQARDKGIAAGVKSNLDTLRSQSVLYFTDEKQGNGVYSTVAIPGAGPSSAACAEANSVFTEPTVKTALQAADRDVGGDGTLNKIKCMHAPDSSGKISVWAVSVPVTGGYWCVDSTGIARLEPADLAQTSCV